MDSALRSKLVDISSVLKEKTEQLNSLLAQAEQKLVSMSLGIEASVTIDDVYRLAFMKYGPDWGLYICRSGESVPTPVLRSSRSLRVSAAMKLDALCEDILSTGHSMTNEVEIAIRSAANFIKNN